MYIKRLVRPDGSRAATSNFVTWLLSVIDRPMYRMLALDIDGTLVNSNDEVSAETRDALRRAAEAGLRIVLATGRRYSRALPLVEPLGIDAPVISASGALIKHPGDHRTLFRAHLDRDDLRALLRVVDQAGFDAILYGDTFAEGFDYYCRRLDVSQPELAEYLALNRDCERLWPQLVTEPPADIFAGFVMGTREQMVGLHHALQSALPGRLYTHVIRSPRYRGFMCEIAPAGATKWSGVLHVAQIWQIAEHEICAVGDDVNDLPMVEGAGLGIAMGNAVPELKAAADRIAPTHDDHGLVQVVDWLLEHRGA
ncbi:MAG: HAD family phosphatase [Planctomycetes bacterium]|nr:HAD family phosphatase [Planctomycetota bacterium]